MSKKMSKLLVVLVVVAVCCSVLALTACGAKHDPAKVAEGIQSSWNDTAAKTAEEKIEIRDITIDLGELAKVVVSLDLNVKREYTSNKKAKFTFTAENIKISLTGSVEQVVAGIVNLSSFSNLKAEAVIDYEKGAETTATINVNLYGADKVVNKNGDTLFKDGEGNPIGSVAHPVQDVKVNLNDALDPGKEGIPEEALKTINSFLDKNAAMLSVYDLNDLTLDGKKFTSSKDAKDSFGKFLDFGQDMYAMYEGNEVYTVNGSIGSIGSLVDEAIGNNNGDSSDENVKNIVNGIIDFGKADISGTFTGSEKDGYKLATLKVTESVKISLDSAKANQLIRFVMDRMLPMFNVDLQKILDDAGMGFLMNTINSIIGKLTENGLTIPMTVTTSGTYTY